MDFVLEELLKYVDQIASAVEGVAPLVWEMLVKQVYVEALANGLGAFAGLVVLIIFIIVIVKMARSDNSNYYDVEYVLPAMSLFLGCVAFFVCLYGVLARFINPDWYAIKLLLEQVQ